MKDLRLVIIALAVIGVAVLAQSAQPASAAFHLMRIHAVMAGLNGDGNVQYVELRMCSAGQPFVSGHTIKFYDGSNTLKGTFTFPSNVATSSLGDSILIATSEYNTASIGPGGGGSGGDADFVFSALNTVAANGGDALHPVQGPNGSVTFAEGAGTGCGPTTPVDSLAYGTGTPDYALRRVELRRRPRQRRRRSCERRLRRKPACRDSVRQRHRRRRRHSGERRLSCARRRSTPQPQQRLRASSQCARRKFVQQQHPVLAAVDIRNRQDRRCRQLDDRPRHAAQ